MKKKFIVCLVLSLCFICFYTFSYVLANEVAEDSFTDIDGNKTNSSATNSSATDNSSSNTNSTSDNTSSSGKLPSTGNDDEYSYTSSNPDDRKNSNIKRTLVGKEVSKNEYQNSQYEYEHITTETGEEVWIGTLRNFEIVNSNNQSINYSGDGTIHKVDGLGFRGISIGSNVDLVNNYFWFESYQYVGEEFTIKGLGTFTCQGIKQSLSSKKLEYYVYTCKIESNDIKKEIGQVSYFEILETDVATNKTYVNWLELSFPDEHGFIISDEETGVILSSDDDILPENTSLNVNTVTSGEIYNQANTLLGDTTSKMYVYDISLESDGVEIQPNGKVKVSIPVPNDINTSKLVIYRITENGEKLEYKATVETIDNKKYATFETDHFSTYVLAEKVNTQSNTTPPTEDKKQPVDNTVTPNILPKAGVGVSLIVMLFIVISFSIFTYKKYNNMKDI